MNKEYTKIVSEIYIKEYIKENKRVPTETELNQYLIEFSNKNPEVDFYGVSGSFIKKFGFLEEVSASDCNRNFKMFSYDIDKQNKDLRKVVKSLDINKNYFQSFAARTMSSLSKIEKRLNNLLINYSNSDIFLHSIEEDFLDHNSVDLKNSSVDFFKGYCTLEGKKKYMDISSSSCSFNFRSALKRIEVGANHPVDVILKQNGEEWIAEFLTTESRGRVVLEVELDFKEKDGLYIGSLILDGKAIEKNSKLYYGTEVQVENKSYRAIEPRIKRFSTGENFTNINEEGVKKIRISLIKESADYMKQNSLYSYVFNLSKIKIRLDRFEKKSGTMYAGPYEVLGQNGDPISFSMAKLGSDTCCILPGQTSVNFYLSTDNENWKEAMWQENQNIVRFDSLDLSQFGEKIDNTISKYRILEKEDGYYLNFKIKSSLIENVNKNNIIIKRNIAQDKILYGAKNGWYFNRSTERYECTVSINNIEGKYIDAGRRSITVNGFERNGLIKLEKGYHAIEIHSDSYQEIPSGLLEEAKIEEQDLYYPYNHKYMVEGYNYPSGYSGEEVYSGIEDRFSFKLKHVAEEKYKRNKSLNTYTLVKKTESEEEYCYFMVNTREQDSSWRDELNDIEIIGSSGEYNKLYVKAVVRSSDKDTVPHINSFNIRVI